MSTPTGPMEPPEERRPSGPSSEPPEAVPPRGDSGAPPPPPPGEQPTGALPPQPEQPTGAYPPPPDAASGAYPAPPPPMEYGGVATGPFTTGEAISYGWRGFTQNLGPLVVLGLIVLVIEVVLNYVGTQLETTAGQVLFGIVSTIIGYILTVGLIRAALAVVDGVRPEVGMLFRGEGVVNYIIASIVTGLAVAIGLVLCIIPGLIVAFLFQFYGFATVDHTHRAGAFEALATSARVARENVGPVLLFDLAAIGVLILGALLCGVGLLVAYPVVIIAAAFVWRRLVRGHVAETG